MAQTRSVDRIRKCLLFGVGRTYDGHHQTDATDPEADISHKGRRIIPADLRGAAPLHRVQGRPAENAQFAA
jgi:hypothetical protein